MKTQTPLKAGFTLVEIMIVVAIIGLLAAIAIPNFVRARENARQNTCINNLRLIDGAKQTWALEGTASPNQVPIEASIAPYLGHGGATFAASLKSAGVYCPDQPTVAYTMGTVGEPPKCSFSESHNLPP